MTTITPVTFLAQEIQSEVSIELALNLCTHFQGGVA